MLVDRRMHIRELGLRRIIKFRESYDNQMCNRPFKVPNLNVNAGDYVDMINWQNVNVTEPPLTRQISINNFKKRISYISDTIDIVKITCDIQTVEQCIKIASNTSTSVCGNKARDGVIRAKLTSQCD